MQKDISRMVKTKNLCQKAKSFEWYPRVGVECATFKVWRTPMVNSLKGISTCELVKRHTYIKKSQYHALLSHDTHCQWLYNALRYVHARSLC